MNKTFAIFQNKPLGTILYVTAPNLDKAIKNAEMIIEVDKYNTVFGQWLAAYMADSYKAELELRKKLVPFFKKLGIKNDDQFLDSLAIDNFLEWGDACSTFEEMFGDDL